MKPYVIFFSVCLLLPVLLMVSSASFTRDARAIVGAEQKFFPVADAYVSSDKPNSNNNDESWLYTKFWDYTTIPDEREKAYLMFDLTMFSPSQDISSAVLRLYAWTAWSPTAHVAVHHCSDNSWKEEEITWMNAPSYSSTVLDEVAVPIEDSRYSWDVTNLVNSFLGKKVSFVLTITDFGDSYTASFYSKERPKYCPELVIEYWSEKASITVDGDPSDWTALGLSSMGTDPAFNIQPYHDTCTDLLEAWACNDSINFYLMIKVRGGYPDEWDTTMFQILMDTDQNLNTSSPEGAEYEVIGFKGQDLSKWNATTLEFETKRLVPVAAGSGGYVEWSVFLGDTQSPNKTDFTFNTVHKHDSALDGVVNTITLKDIVVPEFPSSLLVPVFVFAASVPVLICRRKARHAL